VAFRQLPISNKKTLDLAGDIVIDCIEFVGTRRLHTIRIYSKACRRCRKIRFLACVSWNLSRAENGAAQDGLLGGLTTSSNRLAMVSQWWFSGPSLTCQPEDTGLADDDR